MDPIMVAPFVQQSPNLVAHVISYVQRLTRIVRRSVIRTIRSSVRMYMFY